MINLYTFIRFALLICLIAVSSAVQALTPVSLLIRSIAPSPNAHNAARTQPVIFTFNQTPTAASAQALRVHSFQRGGLRTVATPAVVGTNSIRFTPLVPYAPGETVQFSMATTAQGTATGNRYLARAQVGRFTVATGGTGQGNFIAPASSPDVAVGAGPQRVVAGDVDGDGDLDLLTASTLANRVSVRLNNGAGQFATPATNAELAVGTGPVSLALGDVDSDGDLDLTTANSGTATASIWTNNGTGGFTAGQAVAVGTTPSGVALADIDGDGDLDLFVSNRTDGTVSVRLNVNGIFSGTDDVPVGSQPVAVALGDIDGDGDLDLLVANAGSNTVSVRLNSGLGVFSTGSDYAVGAGPGSVVLADVDGNLALDVLTANATAGTVSVLLNNGSGLYTRATDLTGGGATLALGDVNADGYFDLLTASTNASAVSVRLSLGNGSFLAATQTPAAVGSGPADLALADVDGDGDLDLLAANAAANTVSVRLNGPSGLVAPVVTSAVPASNARAVPRTSSIAVRFSQPLLAGSADALQVFSQQRGGRLTLAAPATASGNMLSFGPMAPGYLPGETIHYTASPAATGSGGALARGWVAQFTTAVGGTGRGGFGPGSDVATGQTSTATALGDVDGDGDLDLLVVNSLDNSISLRLNDGQGGFGGGTTISNGSAITNYASSLALGDLDGDGDLDLVVGQWTGPVNVYFNSGAGVFTLGSSTRVAQVQEMVLGDVDGDGDLDLATTNNLGMSIWLNDGIGNFPGPRTVAPSTSAYNLALGDVDQDGDLDLLAANFNVASISLNDGTGTFTQQQSLTINAPVTTTGSAIQLATGDLDGDGDLDFVICFPNVIAYPSSASLAVALNNGQGTFSQQPGVSLPALPKSVVLGDVDSDGDLDILAASGLTSGTVSVRLNDGTGTFSGGSDSAVGYNPQQLQLGDVDGDGDLDFVCTNYGTSGNTSIVSVRLNGGTVLATRANQSQALGLFPNPARMAVTLSGAAPHAPVQVLDALGRLVFALWAGADGTAQLMLPAGLPAGVYMVRSGEQIRRLVVE